MVLVIGVFLGRISYKRLEVECVPDVEVINTTSTGKIVLMTVILHGERVTEDGDYREYIRKVSVGRVLTPGDTFNFSMKVTDDYSC